MSAPGNSVLLVTATHGILTSRKMKCTKIMKAAVDRLYPFLGLKQRDQKAYESLLILGDRYTTAGDEPALTEY
jgi:hypothetical protein